MTGLRLLSRCFSAIFLKDSKVLTGTHPHTIFKKAVEIGQVVEATVETNLGYGRSAFLQQFTSIAHPHLVDIAHQGLAGTLLKIAAESRRIHPHMGSKFFEPQGT